MRLALGLGSALLFACDPAPREVTAPNTGASSPPREAAPLVSSTPTASPPTVTPDTSAAARFPALDDTCAADAELVAYFVGAAYNLLRMAKLLAT